MHILVIDDSGLIRGRISSMLHRMGHTTIQAVNGKEGLDILEGDTVQCVFTDLLMPVMDGFEFLEKAKAVQPDLPIVVVSADIQKITRDRCFGLGASAVLPKPPKEQEVQDVLSTLVL